MAFQPPPRQAVDAGFVETIRHLLGADNNARNQAEQRYDAAKRSEPVQLVASLVQVLTQTDLELPVREQCAVLLRQCCGKVKEPESTWQKLGTHQAQLRGQLLQILEAEPNQQLRRKVSDCVQSLANQIVEIEEGQNPTNLKEWPELMPCLFRIICDGSKDSTLRADCLWIVKELTCSVWQMLLVNSSQTFQVLQTCLADPAQTVKAEAAALLCSFVDDIPSKEGRKPFQPLIPEVTSVMAQLASNPEPKELNTVLQALQSTTETADFFKQHIASHLIPVLENIAMNHPDESARKYAFEVIVSFMESKPKMMLKVPDYIQKALSLCVTFMMQLNDDMATWMQQDDEDDEDEEFFNIGKESVDRISRCAAKVEAFPLLLEGMKQAVSKLFQSGEWKQVVAGISTLSMIAEYVDDEATVSQMTNGIKMQLAATNARVRYAAWGGIAQFSEDHADVLSSETWTSQLLPEFLKGLDDPCARVSLRCMEAFQHFGESVEREDLEPFIQPLMEKLGNKMQSSDVKLQKKAITFIAVIAGQVDDAFAPYYGHLMPVLKQVIQNTLHKTEERQLLGKCFECISLLARAVGRSGFRADAEQIMQAMIEATKIPNLPNNDPVKEYMMAASERICATLKEDFLPFVSHILPGVLEKFTLAPREFANQDEINDDDEVNLTMIRENGRMKVMIMYSSEIQDLKGALECVHTFVEELAAAYAPFVAQTAQALLPVFDFCMEDGIRDLAFETWGQLCRSARAGGQEQVVRELVMEFLKRVSPKFEAEKVDLAELKTSAEGVTACLREAGPNILHAEQLRHICRSTLAVTAESFKRRAEAAKGRPSHPHDEDGDEHEDDDEEDEQAVRQAMCDVAGPLMQHHADLFVKESFPDYLNLVLQCLQPQAVKEDRKLALMVICDILEHLGQRVTSFWPQFVPKLVEDIHNPDPHLRQVACYGAFLAAKVPDFAPLALEVANGLSQVVTQSRQRSKKKSEKIAQACADNALSAIIEILTVHSQAVASIKAQLWQVWLGGLPCQEDDSEGERNHKKLLELIQQEKPEVVGEGGQNVPKLFGVLVDVYKTDMTDEETSKGIGLFALRLGESKLEGFAAQFSEKQRKKLLRIVREAQAGKA